MKNTDTYDRELQEVRRSVQELRQNLFPPGQRPLGKKHWCKANLEIA